MKDDVWKIANEIKKEIIEFRRHFHMYPELGYEEEKTSEFVIKKLKELSIEVTPNLAKFGVTGLIKGAAGQGKTIGIRADMDALPILEENDVPYKSKHDGKMHACGHDAHTAILLGVAKILVKMKDKIKGNVKLIFQPAEEGLGGAKPMVQEGALKDPEVSAVIALHMADEVEVGHIEVKDGSFTASADKIWFDIEGKGGHAASPHDTIDPIMVGSHLITALQTVASRNTDPVDPVVLTIGTFNAGTVYNVIPRTAHMTGTIRSLKQEVREATFESAKRIAEGVAKAFGAKITPGIKRGYSPGYNSPELNVLLKQATSELVGEDKVHIAEAPSMGAEDFYEFSDNNRIPVAMFWLGILNEKKGIIHPGHNPKYDIDEDALPLGCAILSLTALKYLTN
ncbi:MAG: amidohydrolase [Candidatus Heimdallarchaeota archaeon]|nr:amidohydrolase [Candidatus Heimdallarchaeota archaeon]MBY8996035.1 amidohydrolase [Candidatus Heimdallarchaeota archaeon]